MIEYRIVRSKRKTAQIYILEDGRVEVRCPLYMREHDIARAVAQKEDWIISKIARMKQHKENKKTFTVSVGACIPLLGKLYPIYEKQTGMAGFDEQGFYVPVGCYPIIPQLEKVYRQLAKQIIPPKVEWYAKQMGVEYSAVKITSAHSRWGSCNNKKTLCFSKRLILADERAVDYVVVHELAHLKEMNHSKQFYDIVKHIMPDYKEQETVLKKLSNEITTTQITEMSIHIG